MILRISGENFDLGEDLHKYARSKVERLEKYVPRSDRPTTLIEVVFSEASGVAPLKTCQVSIKLRRAELTARETTQHLYASLDVAVADVEQQLKAYRQHNPGPVRNLLRRVRERYQ